MELNDSKTYMGTQPDTIQRLISFSPHLKDSQHMELSYLDNPDGFDAFYSVVHDVPLPEHARTWVEEIYTAREDSNRGIVIEAFRGSTKTTTIADIIHN